MEKTLLLTHDTSLQRPYNLGFRVQELKEYGKIFTGVILLKGSYIFENKWNILTKWENTKSEWLEKYDHPLWKKHATAAENSGHGGMDYFVDNAFIECIKRNIEFSLDIYDLASHTLLPLRKNQSLPVDKLKKSLISQKGSG